MLVVWWWSARGPVAPVDSAEQECVLDDPQARVLAITALSVFKLEQALSPNGTQVAYVARIDGSDRTPLLVPPRGAAAGSTARCSLGVRARGESDRLPDGACIAFARLGMNRQYG